ncbi:MAG TPA: transglutaminase family protein [Polyangiaceae bacterium]|jgi:transglutaminase-like putative cysteine protease|nr:transglutaminase family protein [Polyangiaceae bacterium]
MKFAVEHLTRYRYSLPVQLGSHVIRLSPRRDVRVVSRDLQIFPEPATRQERHDAHDNLLLLVTFNGYTEEFRVESRFTAETETPSMPPQGTLSRLPWMIPPSSAATTDDVWNFAHQLALDVEFEPIAFLNHLGQTLYQRMDRKVRLEGEAQSASETLSTMRGACRDITVLYLACARALGFAGRFVSGYQAQADTPDGQRYLHAWADIFIPGLGWRGWDPTHGVTVADGHVALCAAPSQNETMPIEGGFSFIGQSINSTLDYSVNISTWS